LFVVLESFWGLTCDFWAVFEKEFLSCRKCRGYAFGSPQNQRQKQVLPLRGRMTRKSGGKGENEGKQEQKEEARARSR
jgi:hypothetical protein